MWSEILITAYKDTVENLERSDPSVTYSQCVISVLNANWIGFVIKPIHFLAILLFYLMTAVVFRIFQRNRMVGVIVLIACALPVIRSDLLLVGCIHVFANNRRKKFDYSLFVFPYMPTDKKSTVFATKICYCSSIGMARIPFLFCGS